MFFLIRRQPVISGTINSSVATVSAGLITARKPDQRRLMKIPALTAGQSAPAKMKKRQCLRTSA